MKARKTKTPTMSYIEMQELAAFAANTAAPAPNNVDNAPTAERREHLIKWTKAYLEKLTELENSAK